MRKPLVVLVTVALAAIPVAVPPALAVYVRHCYAVGNVAFSPALTSQSRSGTMTWTYTNTCAGASTSSGAGTTNSSGRHTYSYVGSCAVATVIGQNDDTGALVGGVELTTAYSAGGRTYTRQWTLVSATGNPCSVPSAIVLQTGPDVFS